MVEPIAMQGEKREHGTTPYDSKLAVSVVVPTYRRPDQLQRCLDALCNQEIEPGCYEIVVVDNAGCPQTREVVARVIRQLDGPLPGIRYVVENGKRGPASARNRGWREARGVVIAFTDDDCIPQPGWLRDV